MTHKYKRCSVAFSSKNRLHSYIRECYIKTITLFSNSIAASHICSVTLISILEKLFNQIAASYISAIAVIVTATTTATNEISTSLYATKKTIFVSKSQIASNFASNSLVSAEIASSISSYLEYRAISSTSSEYKLIKSQSHLTMKNLYTRYSPLKHARSFYLTI